MAETFYSLRTARLQLEPPSDRFVAEVAAELGQIDVARWLSSPPFPYTDQDARKFVEACRSDHGRVWFIKAGDQFVGCASLFDELGFWFAKNAWGKGYATEIARKLSDVWTYLKRLE